jgi:hypothetical protein
MVVHDTVALYNCLQQDLSDDIRRDPATCYAKDALSRSLLKKFSSKTASDADAKALGKFLSANLGCKGFGDHVKERGFWDSQLLGHFREEVHRFCEPHNRGPLVPSFETLFEGARVGPGKTLGTPETDLYNKLFSSDLTSTSTRLVRYYLEYIRGNPRLVAAERQRVLSGRCFRIVEGSSLRFVPKNDSISRVICIEPSLNIFFQLGLGAVMTRGLRQHFGIDLSTQPDVNRELARIGSLDDKLVTLDLESASDSISWKMIVSYFPRSFWTWLWDLRSPSVILPNGEKVQAWMTSNMGNGFTFPLQTIIFSCIIWAAMRFAGRRVVKAGETWSVFGDDIICEQEIAPYVTRLLHLLGFTVNADKSFFEGPFRESCGSDFYIGTNVRGVYLRQLKTEQDICIAINALNHWSALHRVYLRRTVGYLLKLLGRKPLYVPRWENDDAGVKVPWSFVISRLKVHPGYQSVIYRRYQAKPARLVMTQTEVFKAGRLQGRINDFGALSAFLAGVVEGRKADHHTSVVGTVSVRHNTTLYRRTTGVAPNWDSHSGHSLGKNVSPHTWSWYAGANLMG